jgi:hypothetical protein
MSELVLRCPSGRHVLGVVSPAEGYGRLYLRCGKCTTWVPAAPPRDDPQLDTIRCCRRVPDGIGYDPVGRTVVGGGHGVTHHGELLARIALQPHARLTLRCQNQRTIVNVVTGVPPGAAPRYRQTWAVSAGEPTRLFKRRAPVSE